MPWPTACVYLAVCEVQTSHLSTKLARPPRKYCWHDNRRGIKWLVTWHGQGWGDKAREHNHLFHRERLHNNQRCTKIGANNKMFRANYPRDIQKVQGCLLGCTAEAGVRTAARHIVIRQVLLSRARRCIAAAPRGKVRRLGTKEKQGGKGVNICHPKPKLRLRWDTNWTARPLSGQGHGEAITDGAWAPWGAAANPVALVRHAIPREFRRRGTTFTETGPDCQSIKGATLCIALFGHEYPLHPWQVTHPASQSRKKDSTQEKTHFFWSPHKI